MNGFNQYLAATILAAVLCPCPAQAMEIWQFDRQTDADQSDYVGALVVGTERVLRDAAKPDVAAHVHELFTTIKPGDKIPLGVAEFETNLALARVTDAKNVAKDPKAPRIEVEDAMAVTLQKNGIEVPDSFFTVMRDWKPKFPPKN